MERLCESVSRKLPKACAVKNWTTFEGVYFNNGMEQTKKDLIWTNSVALRKR